MSLPENRAGSGLSVPPVPATTSTVAPALPLDEVLIVALLLACPALAKFASVDLAIQRLGHPGLAHVARELVGAVRASRRVNPDRVAARALAGAPQGVRLAVCETSIALGEVADPHEALRVLADRLGACARCGSHAWHAAVLTSTARICAACVRRGGAFRSVPFSRGAA